MEEEPIETERYIQFLKQLMRKRQRPLILLTDRAPFHNSKKLRAFVRAHRGQLRVYFLPRRAPELNPDEQVWNEVKNNKIGKQPVKGKKDLKKRLHSAIHSLQKNTRRIISFFHCCQQIELSGSVAHKLSAFDWRWARREGFARSALPGNRPRGGLTQRPSGQALLTGRSPHSGLVCAGHERRPRCHPYSDGPAPSP